MRKDHATDTVGWTTKEQIGKLHDISDANPRFTVLTDAFVVGLPHKPHEKPEMAKLGELQYWYEHKGMLNTTQANDFNVGGLTKTSSVTQRMRWQQEAL